MKEYIIIGSLMILTILVSGCITGDSSITGGAAADNSEYIKIPLSELSEDVKFYSFDDSGVEIKYFAVIGSDGEPRTAFDACDVCGGDKGYKQEGQDITCRNCGRSFLIDGLGTQNKGSGCWPSYLPHKIEGDNLLIKISNIKGGKYQFN
ncbi:DUF2318 domain-containing protein [Candidatus Woesearchaeota archaeon]|jgi:uncharacterized membrane protein|nr:DUF2318 domain-containing protein [Candidatus Woesearchaeota archaeon]MBT7062672.1 DUF2318 domain-containing protein [Candidatus Woesearchaeota archaeon]MBT7402159.1 DUF2318 domain-containing protein [Candidatus Woesearchaeota archaeon]